MSQRTILRRPAVCTITGVHATTLYRWERSGLFPARVHIGPGSIGWYSDEIEVWLAARARGHGAGRPSPNPQAAAREWAGPDVERGRASGTGA